MPYIGKQPLTGAYQLCDTITTSATATYNLLVGGSAVIPGSAQNCIVSLNGVIQAPVGAFTVSGSQITFASALTSTDVIDFILILGNVFDIGTPTNGSVTNSSLNSNVITGQTAETTIAGGDLVLLYDDSASALRKMTRANFTKGTPTIQRFTSGSGTYTTPSGVTYIIVEMAGGGGGGAGGAVGGQTTTGGNGGNTTFGTSLHTAGGGVGGGSAWTGNGGLGGGLTLGAGATSIFTHDGTRGGGSVSSTASSNFANTGEGGGNPFNGGAVGSTYISAGIDGLVNTGGAGAGGGGGSASGTIYGGSGGGGGGYMKFLISSPSATYAYAIGSGGTAGTGGSGANGGAGGSGVIIVTEYYS